MVCELRLRTARVYVQLTAFWIAMQYNNGTLLGLELPPSPTSVLLSRTAVLLLSIPLSSPGQVVEEAGRRRGGCFSTSRPMLHLSHSACNRMSEHPACAAVGSRVNDFGTCHGSRKELVMSLALTIGLLLGSKET